MTVRAFAPLRDGRHFARDLSSTMSAFYPMRSSDRSAGIRAMAGCCAVLRSVPGGTRSDSPARITTTGASWPAARVHAARTTLAIGAVPFQPLALLLFDLSGAPRRSTSLLRASERIIPTKTATPIGNLPISGRMTRRNRCAIRNGPDTKHLRSSENTRTRASRR